MSNRPRRRIANRDYTIIGLIGVLALIGIVVIYTISPALNYGAEQEHSANYFLYRHLLNTFVGVAGFMVASRLNLERWRRLLPVILIVTAVASLLLFIPATSLTINGATRWIGFGAFSFQPAEIIKFALILYLGFLLAGRKDHEIDNPQATLWPVVGLLGALGVFVVIVQKDLGTMIVLTLITVGMLYFRGLRAKQLAGLCAGIFAASLLAIVAFPHRLSRLFTFLNPSEDTLDAGYHVDQALTAIGSGGLFGQGIGRSVQVYGYLPEAENDSVFAIISEIFGFVGSIAILALLGYLLLRIIKVAESQSSKEGQLIVAGIAVWLGSHVIINVGAMVALLPLTGLTLPFLSYGGSSLLFMMIALGMVFRLSSSDNEYGLHTNRNSGDKTLSSRRPPKFRSAKHQPSYTQL